MSSASRAVSRLRKQYRSVLAHMREDNPRPGRSSCVVPVSPLPCQIEPLEPRVLLDGAPNLPGLNLVDPNVDNLRGQVIYLDFDGAENVTYNGPVTIGPFNVPAFRTPESLAGQETDIMSALTTHLNALFADVGILFTTVLPEIEGGYSTIYLGAASEVFVEYGSFLGLAEQLDIGNRFHGDNALVFTDAIPTFEAAVGYLAPLVAHEVGHLLGYAHDWQMPSAEATLPDLAYDLDTHVEILASASELYHALFGVNGVSLQYTGYLMQDTGNSLRTGVCEEDTPPTWLNHFCAGGDGDELYDGLDLGGWQNTPYEVASEDRYPNAVGAASTAEAYYWLGRAIHLIQDSTVPAHVHKDEHPFYDSYEETAYGNRSYFTFSGLDYWNFQDWSGDWSGSSYLWDRSDDYGSLLSLFRETTDYTDDYDSDDYPGDYNNSTSGDTFSTSRLSTLDRAYHSTWARDYVTGNNFLFMTSTEVQYLARDLGTWAVEQTSMLLRYYFADIGEVLAGAPGLRVITSTSSTIYLDWDPVGSADGYVVYRSSSPSSGYSYLGRASSAQTFYTDTGLPSNTSYYYRVYTYTTVAGLGSAYSSTAGSTLPLPDTSAPAPNPATWSTSPYATGTSSIRMEATTATDPSGVEYYFDETSGNPGGSDSSWQDSTIYEDTGLSANTSYTYRVRTRDKSPNQNTGTWSTSNSAITANEEPADIALATLTVSPSVVAPGGFTGCSFNIINYGPRDLSSESVIVQYWLSSNTTFGDGDDIDIGDTSFTLSLPAGYYMPINLSSTGLANMMRRWPTTTEGNYYVFAKVWVTDGSPSDPDSSDNVTRTNSTVSVVNVDTTPPSPSPSTWATQPYATSSSSIKMTASTASDPSGVEYYCDETSGNPGGSDSGWQDSPIYEDTGLSANTSYTYRVRTRDKSPNQNTGTWSTSKSAVTPTPPTPATLAQGNFDAENDGNVDWDDLQILMANFGTRSVGGAPAHMKFSLGGDTNGDGVVDAIDYIALKTNFGWGTAAPTAPAPEPVQTGPSEPTESAMPMDSPAKTDVVVEPDLLPTPVSYTVAVLEPLPASVADTVAEPALLLAPMADAPDTDVLAIAASVLGNRLAAGRQHVPVMVAWPANSLLPVQTAIRVGPLSIATSSTSTSSPSALLRADRAGQVVADVLQLAWPWWPGDSARRESPDEPWMTSLAVDITGRLRKGRLGVALG